MGFYLWIEGQECGPYTLEDIQRSIDAGDIGPQQMARTETVDWEPLYQIVHIKFPTHQKIEPPTISQLAAPKHAKAHLASIRRNTCYGFLRNTIGICLGLSLACVGISAFVILVDFSAAAPDDLFSVIFKLLTVFGGAGVASILLVASFQSAFLLIDIADTLLHEHSKDRGV